MRGYGGGYYWLAESLGACDASGGGYIVRERVGLRKDKIIDAALGCRVGEERAPPDGEAVAVGEHLLSYLSPYKLSRAYNFG